MIIYLMVLFPMKAWMISRLAFLQLQVPDDLRCWCSISHTNLEQLEMCVWKDMDFNLSNDVQSSSLDHDQWPSTVLKLIKNTKFKNAVFLFYQAPCASVVGLVAGGTGAVSCW